MKSSSDSVVYVVDDDESMLNEIRLLVESAPFQFRGYRIAEAFLADYEPNRPGCVIANTQLPGMSGLEFQEKLRAMGAPMPVVFIAKQASVAVATTAMRSGAFDFFELPLNRRALLDRIRQAIEHDAVACEGRKCIEQAKNMLARLTPRERVVLNPLALGRQSKTIAAELHVSEKTVDAHRLHIRKKLEARTVADVVRLKILASELGDAPV